MNETPNPHRCGRHHNCHCHNPDRRRGPRLARFLIVLLAFAATTAGLHALSDHYGWHDHHWGSHHFGAMHAPSDTAGTATAPVPTAQPALPQQAS